MAVAPASTAALIFSLSSSAAPWLDIGGRVVASSKGSPALSSASAALNFSRNLSAISSATMSRLDATQHWPPLFIRPQTAHGTVLSRSASSRTISASEPPSSMVDFLRFLPARAATTLPAPSLPVSDTPRTRGSSISRLI
jgi:hypothetical protein